MFLLRFDCHMFLNSNIMNLLVLCVLKDYLLLIGCLKFRYNFLLVFGFNVAIFWQLPDLCDFILTFSKSLFVALNS